MNKSHHMLVQALWQYQAIALNILSLRYLDDPWGIEKEVHIMYWCKSYKGYWAEVWSEQWFIPMMMSHVDDIDSSYAVDVEVDRE